MKDYWERNSWFVRTFKPIGFVPLSEEAAPLSASSPSGNEDPSERDFGPDRRGDAPGFELTANDTEPSPFPLDLIKEEAE